LVAADLNLGASAIRADLVSRGGEATTCVLRIFMHALLHLHGSATGNWKVLFETLKPPGGSAGSDRNERVVRHFLEDQMMRDWMRLQEMFSLDEDQVRGSTDALLT
jgi:hypothetical protein